MSRNLPLGEVSSRMWDLLNDDVSSSTSSICVPPQGLLSVSGLPASSYQARGKQVDIGQCCVWFVRGCCYTREEQRSHCNQQAWSTSGSTAEGVVLSRRSRRFSAGHQIIVPLSYYYCLVELADFASSPWPQFPSEHYHHALSTVRPPTLSTVCWGCTAVAEVCSSCLGPGGLIECSLILYLPILDVDHITKDLELLQAVNLEAAVVV